MSPLARFATAAAVVATATCVSTALVGAGIVFAPALALPIAIASTAVFGAAIVAANRLLFQ